MFLKIHETSKFLAVTIMLPVLFCSCSLVRDQEQIKKRIEATKQKILNYNTLYDDIVNERIQNGAEPKYINEHYGLPDDVFHSGSAAGNFEMWTYERIYEKGEEGNWQNIRLYFNNNKLVSWQY